MSTPDKNYITEAREFRLSLDNGEEYETDAELDVAYDSAVAKFAESIATQARQEGIEEAAKWHQAQEQICRVAAEQQSRIAITSTNHRTVRVASANASSFRSLADEHVVSAANLRALSSTPTSPKPSVGEPVKFNINNEVLVKLTDVGREIYRKHWEPFGGAPANNVDAEGWSRFQLWDLMRIFGESLFNGCDVPFEMEIVVPALKARATPSPTTSEST